MAKKAEKTVEKTAQPYSNYTIRARIIDAENDMRFLPEVSAVRIRSAEYVLLVLADYMPALGEINGSVSFLTPEEEIFFTDIHGFYKHQHNEFTLLIDGAKRQTHQEEDA